jgi:hypothetical protein
MTIEDIVNALADLKEEYDVHTIDDAWYSFRAMSRAIGHSEWNKHPAVTAVQRKRPAGECSNCTLRKMTKFTSAAIAVSARPEPRITAWFCLSDLKAKVESLRDHNCPPWPG